MKDQRELDAYLAAYADDDDNVRGDYPAAIKTIIRAVRDIAATERERNELRAEVERIKGFAERGVAAEAAAVKQLEAEAADKDAYIATLVADVDRLEDEIADRESERADLRDRVTKYEAIVARVGALAEKWSKRHPNPEFGAWTTWAADNLRAALDGGGDE